VGRIRARGLLTFQPSHWAKASGERYGEGQVFAFENKLDAQRWALRMDWMLHQATGSGKISIIEFFASPTPPHRARWDVDKSDPISQAMSKGRWFKSYSGVRPSQIIGVTKVGMKVIKAVMAANV